MNKFNSLDKEIDKRLNSKDWSNFIAHNVISQKKTNFINRSIGTGVFALACISVFMIGNLYLKSLKPQDLNVTELFYEPTNSYVLSQEVDRFLTNFDFIM